MAYVDTEKIKKALNNFSHIGTGDVRYDCGYDDCMTAVQDTISDLPTADVVEVVRCKDCKFAYKNRFLGEYHCEKTNCKIKAHHFCGQGIRK